MKSVTKLINAVGTKLRGCSWSVAQRVREIARAARSKSPAEPGKDKLLKATSRVVGQAKRFAQDITNGVKRWADVVE